MSFCDQRLTEGPDEFQLAVGATLGATLGATVGGAVGATVGSDVGVVTGVATAGDGAPVSARTGWLPC